MNNKEEQSMEQVLHSQLELQHEDQIQPKQQEERKSDATNIEVSVAVLAKLKSDLSTAIDKQSH